MHVNVGSIRQWHWISASVSLAGMLMFAITGITLNHATQIQTEPHVTVLNTSVPAHWLPVWREKAAAGATDMGMPLRLRHWLSYEHGISIPETAEVEWSAEELYIVSSGPGVDAWLALDLELNELTYEKTDRGWLAYFNDLHKGRDTGSVWAWFIDIFAAACIVFCVTGLILLSRQSTHRQMTWPLTALGVVGPAVLLLLFVH